MSGAAYLSQDALWLASIRRAPRDEEAALSERAEQQRLVKRVKEAWLPLEDYAGTHQKTYPRPEEGLAGVIRFARNGSLPDGLVYTYAGGSVDSISDRASTELAHILGAGGRAVLYADGHAAWISR